jgi:ATP-dependent Clp protease ATP-binding subunit ClpA
LVGPDGAGKSAILRGLAQRIVEGNVIPAMKNKTVLPTGFRWKSPPVSNIGANLKKRFRMVLNNIKESSKNSILVIDDFPRITKGFTHRRDRREMAGPLKAFLARGGNSRYRRH